ncbi:hypothetical protein ON010_g11132 [Phytophthora cinnamomi]|nr:hypothetical protein ON010_g11132 [Phytophthora cinnamomi]
MRALFMATIALVVAVTNHYHPFVVATRNSTAFTDSLTVFNTFLGLIISFRLNSAFTQWRAGMVAMGALSEAAREIVGSGCAYVSTTIKEELKERNVEDADGLAVHEDVLLVVRDLAAEAAVHRVVLEHVLHVLGGDEGVVHGHHVDLGVLGGGAQHEAADAAESIDGDVDHGETWLLK